MVGPDSPKESDTERTGLLSYPSEWHALAIGLYSGMRTFAIRPRGLPDNPDVQKEPHYFTGGYVIGTILQFIIMIFVVVTGFGVL